MKYDLSISIVSHGQSALVGLLLEDLRRLAFPNVEIIITINIPEDEVPFANPGYPSQILRNPTPLGFGANHNNAFEKSRGRYFAVVNPDIRLKTFDLEQLFALMSNMRVGVIAPVVLNSKGDIEDSARFFPTIANLFARVLGYRKNRDYQWDSAPIEVNWVAGMFMVFRRQAFKDVAGFDCRRFFMYFEDVDICSRLWKSGWPVVLQPGIQVIHDAQRDSHKSLKHMRWHLTSATRYLSGL